MTFNKKCFLLLISLLFMNMLALAQQVTIKGRVVDNSNNEPLEFVTVYLNSTTFGAITNQSGEFAISAPPGKYDVVVSYMGYTPIIYQVEAEGKPAPLLFKLTASEDVLNEVVVEAKRDSSWYQNLEAFKNTFLGTSKNSQKCKLLNPEVLIIDFNPATGVLEVKARDLLKIENPALGYRINYLLVDYKYFTQEQYVAFLGYTSFEEMQAGKAKMKKYERKRLEAYKGSVMHFVRSLRAQKLEEEGFVLRRLVRKPNPDRPSDEEISRAREIVKARGSGFVLKKDDPLAITLSKSNLPKTIGYLDKNPFPYQQLLSRDGQAVVLAFQDYLQVVYTHEKEEEVYVRSSMLFGSRKSTYQTSVIFLRSKSVILDETGNITEPLDMLFEGYLGWEKVGDMVPFDYQVRSESQ